MLPKKPRFDVRLRILDLSNLPQLLGLCFIKYGIKDASGPASKPLSSLSHPHTFLGTPTTSALRSTASQTSEAQASLFKSAKGTTSHKAIENHKVKFDTVHELHNVRFEIDRKLRDRPVLLADRHLIVSVYSDAEGDHEKRSFLGSVKISLVDVIARGFDKNGTWSPREPSVDKYLLQELKINSILSVSVTATLAKGELTDFANTHRLVKPAETAQSSTKDVPEAPKTENTINIGDESNISNIELITKLYYETFQVPWDPRPNEYNPSECVEDIFRGGNGWKRTVDGANLVDVDYIEKQQSELQGLEQAGNGAAASGGANGVFSPDMDFVREM